MFANGADWPEAAAAAKRRERRGARAGACIATTDAASFTDVTAAYGLQHRHLRHGRRGRGLRQRRLGRLLLTAVGQNRLFRNTGKGTFVDVTARAGLGGREAFSTSALWVDFDKRRLARSARLQLREVDAADRHPLQRRRQAEVVLHAGSVSRQHVVAVPQSRQRHVRGRHGDVGPVRRHVEIARRDHPRLRPGRLARSLHRQRHAAEQALSQQSRQARSPSWACRPAWRSAKTAARAPAWAWMPPTTTTPAARRSSSPTSRARCSASTRRRKRAATSIARRVGCRARDASDARVGLLLLRRRSRRSAGSAGRERAYRRGGGARASARAATPSRRICSSIAARRAFATWRPRSGGAFAQPKVGRGAAFADIDADGDLDVVMTTNGGPAYLFRNDLANGHRSVRLRLRGVTSNRDAIGALVRAKIGGRTLVGAGEDGVELSVAVGTADHVRRRLWQGCG